MINLYSYGKVFIEIKAPRLLINRLTIFTASKPQQFVTHDSC